MFRIKEVAVTSKAVTVHLTVTFCTLEPTQYEIAWCATKCGKEGIRLLRVPTFTKVYTIEGLKEYTNYTISVSSFNDCGKGNNASIVVGTKRESELKCYINQSKNLFTYKLRYYMYI